MPDTYFSKLAILLGANPSKWELIGNVKILMVRGNLTENWLLINFIANISMLYKFCFV